MAKYPITDKNYPFHLKTLRITDLNLCIGNFHKVTLDARSVYSRGVEIKKANSIINICFKIPEFDL